jgi:hypothetical protein
MRNLQSQGKRGALSQEPLSRFAHPLPAPSAAQKPKPQQRFRFEAEKLQAE